MTGLQKYSWAPLLVKNDSSLIWTYIGLINVAVIFETKPISAHLVNLTNQKKQHWFLIVPYLQLSLTI